jgi:hypothetical protein
MDHRELLMQMDDIYRNNDIIIKVDLFESYRKYTDLFYENLNLITPANKKEVKIIEDFRIYYKHYNGE